MIRMKSAVALVLVACSHVTTVPMHPLERATTSHYLAGRLAMYREDYATAVTELVAAAQLAPDQPAIAILEAQALARAKRVPEAQTVLAHARETWPDHSQVWLASGELLEKLRPDDAEHAFERTIALEADSERAYLGLARLQLARHDDKAAEHTLRGLVTKVPGSTDGHYRLAQRLLLANDLTGAVGELHGVLELDPDHIDARLDLARTFRRLGKLDDAIAQTRSAFDRSAQPLDIADELFWLLCEADDRQGAIDLLTLLDDDRSDVEALASVLGHDLGLGRMPEALAVVGRIATQNADAGALALAEYHLATHELGKTGEPLAVADIVSIPSTSVTYALAHRYAALALLDAQMPKRALELLEPARLVAPKDTELAYTAAIAAADAGAVADGRALLAPGTLERARFEDHLHDSAAALAILLPIVNAHPNSATALNLTGYLLADRKERLDEAEKLLAHARELSPGDPAVLDSWGWLALQRGRTREAIRALDHASRFSPREPEIMLHLASAWASDHQPKTAARLLDQALGLHPAPDVKRRIDALRSTLVIK